MIKNLIKWSEQTFVHLPWRKNRTLYHTLVSEIMLQQTTVGTVLNHFERFIVKYPTISSLAKSSEEEMLMAWKGLGYYRRAKNLKLIAETIQSEFKGKIPEEIDVLTSIKGIGPYTANALLAIGMDKRALAIDANLERVIARLYALNEPKGTHLHKHIHHLFAKKEIFSDKVSPRGLNEALMDLGRTFCQARKVSCDICPMNDVCLSYKQGNPLQYPIGGDAPKIANSHELKLLRIVVKKGQKLAVYLKDEKEWLSGQYEIPTFIIRSDDKNLKQYPRILKKIPYEGLAKVKTGITKYSIENYILEMNEGEFAQLNFPRAIVWKTLKIENENYSTTTIKCLKKLKLI
jgi:A/G-specific adenine glycosylase